MQDIKDRL